MDMFGGQAHPNFDNDLAPFLKESENEIYNEYKKVANLTDEELNNYDLKETRYVRELMHKKLIKVVSQAMQAICYNLNSMHCLPYSERIWVYDLKENDVYTIKIGDLANIFENNRFKAFSINRETGETELKFITNIMKKDNNRKIIAVIDKEGRKFRSTDNHKAMYLNKIGKISEDYPTKIPHTLSPRGLCNIPVKYDIGLDKYSKRESKNYLQDHIIITEEFCKIAGYYVSEGSITGISQLCFTVCDKDKENELISLMTRIYSNITYSIYTTDDGKPKYIRFNVGARWCRMFKDKFGISARYKKIPIEILFGTKEKRIQFLNGYFKCDGSIKKNYIVATTTSRKLRDQLNLMLISLGELPHIAIRETDSEYGKCISYEISISGKAENRLGLEFNCISAYEQKHYDYSILKDIIKKKNKLKGVRTIRPENIDTFAFKDESLNVAKNVFPVQIDQLIESNSNDEYVYDISVEDNETFLTEDCIFVHNSRAGSQVPFSSINLGLPQTKEAALITEWFLKKYDEGMGKGESFIFPNIIFKVKDGINKYPGDPYYYLFKLACKVASKRMNPTFMNIDADFNLKYYLQGYTPATMGCRTYIMDNINGEPGVEGRGNIAPTTINLPRIGIEAKLYDTNNKENRIKKFKELLLEKLYLSRKSLLYRYDILKRLKVKDLPFIAGEKLIRGSENLDMNDSIEPILKQGTYGIGFVGLAETLVALIGSHHGESAEAQSLGVDIVSFIRRFCDKYKKIDKLNWSCYATPAETTTNKLLKIDREKFGEIEGVTDKDYYTNSFHVPVGYNISIKTKLFIEAPYHKLCNGGHISYIELDNYPTAETVEKIISYAYTNTNISYIGINFHMRYCKECGTRVEPSSKVCPKCGSKNIQGVSRITGYLALDERFGEGKSAERRDRISHENGNKVYNIKGED